MTRVVTLGGGISGLTAAFLSKRTLEGASGCVYLVERQSRAGGWFQSERDTKHGFLVERGPHSFRPVGPSGKSAVRLLEELGIEGQAVGTSETAKKRFLWVDKHLHELPSSLKGLFTNPLTNKLPWLGLREALFVAKNRSGQDESVHDFFSRRFSPWVADTFADGLVQGIFAGDTRQLSLEACFPVLHELESKYGSVVGGMMKKSLFGRQVQDKVRLETAQGKELVKFTGVSFPDGMSRLTEELERQTFRSGKFDDRLDCRLFEGKAVTQITKDRKVILDDGTCLEADFVLSSLPMRALQTVLPDTEKPLLEPLLTSTKFVSVGVINLLYADMPHLPKIGFGHLVPTNQKEGVLGMIYDSEVFPSQQPENCSAITVMIGGAKFPEYAELSEGEMVDFAVRKAEEHLGITVPPTLAVACVHKNCIPQYGIGHRSKVLSAKKELLSRLPFLRVFGNNFEGVGIADSIANARKAVDSIDLNVHIPFK